MQLLIDTHVLIWWWADDDRLPERLHVLLGQSDTVVFVSTASALEMAIKVRGGKLPAMAERVAKFSDAMTEDGFIQLVMKQSHALKAGLLPGDHKDPFDRVLAAQSILEELPIVTRDPAFRGFGCKVLW